MVAALTLAFFLPELDSSALIQTVGNAKNEIQRLKVELEDAIKRAEDAIKRTGEVERELQAEKAASAELLQIMRQNKGDLHAGRAAIEAAEAKLVSEAEIIKGMKRRLSALEES